MENHISKIFGVTQLTGIIFTMTIFNFLDANLLDRNFFFSVDNTHAS